MNHQTNNPTPINYYENGDVKVEKVDIDTSRCCYKEYYENRNLKSETPFFMNLQCGIQKEYYECGNLKSEIHYFMGKQMDAKKRYFRNGILKRQQRQTQTNESEGA